MDDPIAQRLRPRKGRATQAEHTDPPQQTPSKPASKSTTPTSRSTTISRKTRPKGIKKTQAKERSTTTSTTPSKAQRKSAVEKKKKKSPPKDATFRPDPTESSDDEAETPVQQQPNAETPPKRRGKPFKTPVKDGAYRPGGDESDDEASVKTTRKPRSTKRSIRKPTPIPFVPIPEDGDSAKTHPPPKEGLSDPRNPKRRPIKITLKVKKASSPRPATPDPRRRSASGDVRSNPNIFHTATSGARIDDPLPRASPSPSTRHTRPSPSPRPSPKSPKRPAPVSDGDGRLSRSPKRPRFENTTLHAVGSSSSKPRASSTQPPPPPPQQDDDHLTIADADRLFEEIVLMPRKLELGEIAALFVCLQEKCMRFSQKHFSFDLTEEQQEEWPLHRLDEQKYRSFFNMARFLVDTNHCGWREFFTTPQHRVPFVHGVLGERFKNNIFKIPGFGLGRDKVNRLAEIDRSYLKYDAFVRSKVRAEYLEELKFDKVEDWYSIDENVHNVEENTAASAPIPTLVLPGAAAAAAAVPWAPSGTSPASSAAASDPSENYFPSKYAVSLDKNATELASHIMEQLELILPPPIFDPLHPHGPRNFGENSRKVSAGRAIEANLTALIKYMGGLSLSIRFTGIDGTIIRLVEAYPKGTEYHIADSTDNICVNADHCNATCPADTTPATLRIYMTCWCRLEGVVPHGKNRLELEKFQMEHQDPDAPETFTWEQYEDEVFPPLPYELQTTPEGRAAVEDLPVIPGTEWGASMARVSAKDHVFEGDDEDDNNRHGRRRRNGTDKRAPGPERGCFVTYYNRLAPTNVYCAWTSKARPTRFPDLGDDLPQLQRRSTNESLEDAIVRAKLRRRDLRGQTEDDSYIGSTMNLIREYHVGEWLVASSMAGGLLAYILSADRGVLGRHFDEMVAALSDSALVRRLQTIPSSVVTRVGDALGLPATAARHYVVTLLAWARHLEQRTAHGVRDAITDLTRSVEAARASLVAATTNTPTSLDVTTLFTPPVMTVEDVVVDRTTASTRALSSVTALAKKKIAESQG
ncbi:hypothetical protein LTS17_006809 [Exophiala oligosperma]